MSDRAASVRRMFAGIAPRYDLLNHLLSFSLDRLWRRAAVRAVRPLAGERALDACAGTLDLTVLLARAGARVVALDFCREMLVAGRAKTAALACRPQLVEGDALALPFRAGSFDVVTAAFGVRNLDDPRAGLAALAGLLAPGGRLAVLEFRRPRNPLFRRLYYAYFHHLLPRIGALVSRHHHAYRYLPDSVMSFLEPEDLARTLAQAGLEAVRVRALGFGAVALVTARRPDRRPPPAAGRGYNE